MNKFRNFQNVYYERDLFEELSSKPDIVLYTLKREDTEYPSLYRLYMELEDFTEFEFAVKYFESFQHWKKISNSSWFAGYISEWREELELKIKARNLKSLIRKAEQDSNVAKYLLGNKWVEQAQEKNPGINLRGRPSKEDIRAHLRLITMDHKEAEKDLERITSNER